MIEIAAPPVRMAARPWGLPPSLLSSATRNFLDHGNLSIFSDHTAIVRAEAPAREVKYPANLATSFVSSTR